MIDISLGHPRIRLLAFGKRELPRQGVPRRELGNEEDRGRILRNGGWIPADPPVGDLLRDEGKEPDGAAVEMPPHRGAECRPSAPGLQDRFCAKA